jgi:hypothetical protein
MELLLNRQKPTEQSIPGELFVGGDHECWSLENRDLSIPPGRFPVTMYRTPNFAAFKNHLPPEWDHTVPLLQGVPNRTSIEIHPANVPEQLHGCIAPGETHAADFVGASGIAFMALWRQIRAVLPTEEVWITVHDWPGVDSEKLAQARPPNDSPIDWRKA